MRAALAVVATIVLSACGSPPPCTDQRVVQSSPAANLTKEQIEQIMKGTVFRDVEVDDGHVYRGIFGYDLATGSKVTVCHERSKIDGSEHYSIRQPGGATQDVDRVQ